MSTAVADLVAYLRGDTSDFDAAMQSASGSVAGFQAAVGSSSNLNALGSALSMVAAAATGAFITGIVKAIETTNQFDQMVQQSAISLQGLGKSMAQAQQMTSQSVNLAEKLGIDPQQVQKSQQLLEGLVGSYADTAENITKLAGAAATAQQPLSAVTDQVATVANIMATNPSQGTWYGMQLAKQNIESYTTVNKAQAEANSGASESQVFQTLINGLHGGTRAAKEYADTLTGLKSSLKTLGEADVAKAFSPIYDDEEKLLEALNKIAASPGMKQFATDVANDLEKLNGPLEKTINDLTKFANKDLTPQNVDKFMSDLEKMIPLLTTLGGMSMGDTMGSILGKIPVLGDVLGPVGGLMGAGGALGGMLAGSSQGRQALGDMAGAASQLGQSLMEALPAATQFFQVIVGPIDDIVKISAAILNLASSFKPLDDAIAVFIAAYAGIKVWKGIADIAGTVVGAMREIQTATESRGLDFLSTGVDMSSTAAATEGMTAEAMAIASVQEAEENLVATQAAYNSALAEWQAAVNDATISIQDMAAYDERLAAANQAVTESLLAQADAQDALNTAREAGMGTMAGGGLAGELGGAAGLGEDAGLMGGALGADGALSLLGPIGLVAGLGLTGYAAYQMFSGSHASSSNSFMNSFNAQHPATIGNSSIGNNVDNLKQIQDRANAAKQEVTKLNDEIDKTKHTLASDKSRVNGIGGLYKTFLEENPANLPHAIAGTISAVHQPTSDAYKLKGQEADLKSIQQAYDQASAAAKNLQNNVSAAMSATGQSQKQVMQAAQQLGIDLTMSSGTALGKQNLQSLEEDLKSTKNNMDSAATSATAFADSLNQLSNVIQGKTGKTRFSIGGDEIAKMQREANALKKQGYDTSDFQNDINQLKPDVGQTFGTTQSLQLQLTRMQQTQQEVQDQQQLAQAQYEVGQAAFQESQAEFALQQSYVQLKQAEQGVVEAQQQLVDAQHGVIEAQNQLVDAQHGVIESENQYNDAAFGVISAEHQLADANFAVIEAENQLVDATNAVVNAQESLQNAMFQVGQAQFSLSQANMKMTEDLITQSDAEDQVGQSLQGFTDKYATLNANLNELLPNQMAWGQEVVNEANDLDDLQHALTTITNQYTLANDSLTTLKDTQQEYQEIASQPLQGTSQYNAEIQGNKMQQAALQSQINQLELEGANTQSEQIINLQNHLDVLQKIGQQDQLNQQMTVGNEQFQIHQAENPASNEIDFSSALTAANNMGQLQGAVVSATEKVDALKPAMDAAKESVDALSQTVVPQITALQNLESADENVRTQSNAVEAAQQQLTVAIEGVTHAQEQLVDADNSLTAANHQLGDATFGVESAQRALTNAQNSLQSATWALTDAQNSLTSAQWGVNDATNAVTNAENSLASAQNSVVVANNAIQTSVNNVTNAQNSYKLALQQVANTQAQIAIQTVQNSLTESQAVENYVSDAMTALQNLTIAEQNASAGLSNTLGSMQNQVNAEGAQMQATLSADMNYANQYGANYSSSLSAELGFPAYASGGLIDHKGLFMGGESGNELVLPLTDSSRSINLMAQYAPELMALTAARAMSNSMTTGSSAGNAGRNVTVQSGAVQVQVTGTGIADLASEIEQIVEQAFMTVVNAIPN